LANLNEFKRRALLNTVTDEQYEDIVNVLMMMPRLEVETEIEGTILHNFTNFVCAKQITKLIFLVQGEDDKHTVTIGSVVTVKVTLKRSPLLDHKKREQELAEGPKIVEKEEKEEEESQQNKRKVWEKQPKKKTKKGGKGGNKVRKFDTQMPKICYFFIKNFHFLTVFSLKTSISLKKFVCGVSFLF
jgi:hypothetical protein